MTTLDQLRAFVAVVDTGGFATAARLLGLSAPAITRAVAALEAHLGAHLLHRTTRSLHLTDSGERFLQRARLVLATLNEAEAEVRGEHIEPQGELGVTGPVLFSRLHLMPVIHEFLLRHPRVTARMMVSDRAVNLMDDGLDVALRIGDLPDSSLTAIRVGSVRRVVAASPRYLAAHGTPVSPGDISEHVAIGYSQGVELGRWTFAASGKSLMREVDPPRTALVVNSQDLAIEAALAGHGLVRALSYQVRDHVAAGQLAVVLAAFEPAPVPVHLVCVEWRRAAAKVKKFVDFASERLRAIPALNEASRPQSVTEQLEEASARDA